MLDPMWHALVSGQMRGCNFSHQNQPPSFLHRSCSTKAKDNAMLPFSHGDTMVFFHLFPALSIFFPWSETRFVTLGNLADPLSAGQHVPFWSRSGRRRRKRPRRCPNGPSGTRLRLNLEAYWRSTVEPDKLINIHKLILAGNCCVCELVSGAFHNSQLPFGQKQSKSCSQVSNIMSAIRSISRMVRLKKVLKIAKILDQTAGENMI